MGTTYRNVGSYAVSLVFDFCTILSKIFIFKYIERYEIIITMWFLNNSLYDWNEKTFHQPYGGNKSYIIIVAVFWVIINVIRATLNLSRNRTTGNISIRTAALSSEDVKCRKGRRPKYLLHPFWSKLYADIKLQWYIYI